MEFKNMLDHKVCNILPYGLTRLGFFQRDLLQYCYTNTAIYFLFKTFEYDDSIKVLLITLH